MPKTPPNSGKPWSDKDVSQLQKLSAQIQAIHYNDGAKIIERTVSALEIVNYVEDLLPLISETAELSMEIVKEFGSSLEFS